MVRGVQFVVRGHAKILKMYCSDHDRLRVLYCIYDCLHHLDISNTTEISHIRYCLGRCHRPPPPLPSPIRASRFIACWVQPPLRLSSLIELLVYSRTALVSMRNICSRGIIYYILYSHAVHRRRSNHKSSTKALYEERGSEVKVLGSHFRGGA